MSVQGEYQGPWPVDAATEDTFALDATGEDFARAARLDEREECALLVERFGCTKQCGMEGRWPYLPEGQKHWGDCAVSIADQIRQRTA